MAVPDVERILRAFQAPDPARDGQPPGLAAVLLALYDRPDGAHLLYIRRADHLRTHPGEVSFPGGRVEPGETPMEAALREAHEEVGLDPRQVERVAHVVDFRTHRGSTVCAYVGRARGEPPAEPASLDEVADVFTLPLATLLDPTFYEARRISGMPPDRRVHYWHVQPRTVWGITGELTARFLAQACGWTPPARVRTVSSVADFVPADLREAPPRTP